MQVLGILVENQLGVLGRVAGAIGRRGFNIESLVVGACADPELARMNVCINTDEVNAHRLLRHINNLINVVAAAVLPTEDRVCSEMAMIKVYQDGSDGDLLEDITDAIAPFRGNIAHVGPETLIVRVVNESSRIEELVGVLAGCGIAEIVRTGPVALSEADESLRATTADHRRASRV